jgi:hypothetical protein
LASLPRLSTGSSAGYSARAPPRTSALALQVPPSREIARADCAAASSAAGWMSSE